MMARKARPLTDLQRVAMLEDVLDQAIAVGKRNAQLQTADFNIYVDVRIEKRARPDANTQYLEAALARLAERKFWKDSCGESTTKPSRFGRGTTSCSNSIGYVVVTEEMFCRPPLAPLHFNFVCAAHANKARVLAGVLAVVLLPKARLEPIRRTIERREEERRRSERAGELGAQGFCDFIAESQRDAKMAVWRQDGERHRAGAGEAKVQS